MFMKNPDTALVRKCPELKNSEAEANLRFKF